MSVFPWSQKLFIEDVENSGSSGFMSKLNFASIGTSDATKPRTVLVGPHERESY